MADWPAELRARVAELGARQRWQTAMVERWDGLAAADAERLAEIAEQLRLGENQLRDFFDWAEEIAVRDGSSIAAVLGGEAVRRALERDLGRNDGIRALREALRRLRYPRLTEAEDELGRRLRALRLPAGARVLLPPNLQDAELRLEIRASDPEVLRRTLEEVAELDFSGLFALMSGRRG